MFRIFKSGYKITLTTLFILFSELAIASVVDYDIIYVRYPNANPGVDSTPDIINDSDPQFVTIPQGEKPYDIAAGADLIRLLADGTEEILVDCPDDGCSVMDPFISYDANWVYYSLIEEASYASASWIYKIDLTKKPYTPIRLTYDDGFDSPLYAGNTTAEHDQESSRKIRDMAPVPLADGRIMFTSNRSAITTFKPETDAYIRGSVQQLYAMDDHDGSANNKTLANIERIETGNISMVQHPIQLKDGRILVSSWQDFGTKFRYAMTNLFTLNPDGSKLKQFTEPHDRHRTLDHFITQLSNTDVISGYYYPSFDYGYGLLMRYPLVEGDIHFTEGPMEQRYNYGEQYKISFREFERIGTVSMTPHSIASDHPVPDASGKYSMPSATKNNGLLMAYSKGTVNHFASVCNKDDADQCNSLMSGIYLINNADTTIIENPNQLIKVKDDPNYNEIWPRAILSYQEIYGQVKPDIIPHIAEEPVQDSRLKKGEPYALIGTSSMYNRESKTHPRYENDEFDPFKGGTDRVYHDGNWTIQGAEAGIFENKDIYAVRIIGTPIKPFTKPIDKFIDSDEWYDIKRYLTDSRLARVVARYSSLHGERWEVIGEFPLTNRGSTDEQGNPDTSWIAKVPAETPLFIQALDQNGMTIVSEQTWRALKPGEKRVDCGGCHAHSIKPLDFETTQAGNSAQISSVNGVESSDTRIQNGIWDLTQDSIPLLANDGVEFKTGNSLDVEFNRDVLPIINNKCVSCHSVGGAAENNLLLKFPYALDDPAGDALATSLATNKLQESNTDRNAQILTEIKQNFAHAVLTFEEDETGYNYDPPQQSKYIRVPQARQSLLTWVVYGERLDGRTNETRDDDIDYPTEHPTLGLTDSEKRTFARWIDLGSPIDFPVTDGFGYTNDNQLPIINIAMPTIGDTDKVSRKVYIGLADAKSGLNWDTLSAKYYAADLLINDGIGDELIDAPIGEEIGIGDGLLGDPIDEEIGIGETPQVNILTLPTSSPVIPLTLPVDITPGGDTVLEVEIEDNAGNKNVVTKRFSIISDNEAPEILIELESQTDSPNLTGEVSVLFSDDLTGIDYSTLIINYHKTADALANKIEIPLAESTLNGIEGNNNTLVFVLPDELIRHETYTLEVSVQDNNTNPANVYTTFVIEPDETGPDIEIGLTLSENETSKYTRDVSIMVSDQASGVEISTATFSYFEGDNFATNNSNKIALNIDPSLEFSVQVVDSIEVYSKTMVLPESVQEEKVYTFEVTVFDKLGNSSNKQQVFTLAENSNPVKPTEPTNEAKKSSGGNISYWLSILIIVCAVLRVQSKRPLIHSHMK